jgi:uncharacterized membrane protein YeaQ/YmgE (transglycosylase-associated protein family)
MNILGLLILLAVAAFCGAIGAALAGYTTRGCFTSIILGFIGAIIGTWLSRQFHIPDFIYFYRIPVVWSIIGSAIFVAIVHVFIGKKKRKSRRSRRSRK